MESGSLNRTPSAQKKACPLSGQAFFEIISAATYFPTQSPMQYHRRNRA
jgi:hypothetical protein